MTARALVLAFTAAALCGGSACIVPARVELRLTAADAGLDAREPLADGGLDAGLDADADADSDAFSDQGPEVERPDDGILPCPPGRSRCGDVCVDLGTDGAHCGRCDNACGSVPNATSASCDRARCVPACTTGFADCNGVFADGCEARLDSDPNHCGRCGLRCSYAHADGLCVAGACTRGGCQDGYDDCNGRPADGCETSLRTNLDCGTCGMTCARPMAVTSCATGRCLPIGCVAGFGDCDGVLENGCESALNTDINCGGCALRCVPDHSSGRCSMGSCLIGTCDALWGDCDNLARNGCERLLTSLTDCGRCGQACIRVHATAECTTGACRVGVCESGWGNCNRLDPDGCETDLSSSQAHCGACGNACAGNAVCIAGTCRLIEQRSCPDPVGFGCGLVEVPAGTFDLGAADATNGTPPRRGMQVHRLAVDAFEVSVARFRRYWLAGHPAPAASVNFPGGSINDVLSAEEPRDSVFDPQCTWSSGSLLRERLPLNCVNWTTAMSFCVWDGGRLPTETEWEWIARGRTIAGGGSPRVFPWGDATPSGSVLVACDRAQWNQCPGEQGTPFRVIGSFPANGNVHDLGGNVSEWTADSFRTYTDLAFWGVTPLPADPLCTDLPPVERTVRGGNALTSALENLRAAARSGLLQTEISTTVGFRCVHDRP